jgi:hypothetical protein
MPLLHCSSVYQFAFRIRTSNTDDERGYILLVMVACATLNCSIRTVRVEVAGHDMHD